MRPGVQRLLQRSGADGAEEAGAEVDEEAGEAAGVDLALEAAVDEVNDALWRQCRLLYAAFDYYCVLGGGEKASAQDDVDSTVMTRKAFGEFARDCGLVCASVPLDKVGREARRSARRYARLAPQRSSRRQLTPTPSPCARVSLSRWKGCGRK